MENQTKVVIALLLLTILGTLIVAIILIPSDITELKETAKNETLHPCQIAALEEFNMYKDNAQYRSDPNSTAEDFEEYSKELLMRSESNKKLFEENNCTTIQPEWYTPEFKNEMQALLDEGF